MATEADLERVIRKVLNEGTGNGQKTWAGTSAAMLGALQNLFNILRQEVIPRLPGPSAPAPAAAAAKAGDKRVQ
jgi:hypothetical protein